MTWTAIAVLAIGTYAMRAVGPVVLGRRTFPSQLQHLFTLLAVALLAAVIGLATFADGARLRLDVPLVVGVAVAGVAAWRRAPFVVVVVAAAATAAFLRAVA